MKAKVKGYKIALHKSYFDKGYGITSYLKYMIAYFGLASSDVKLTLIIGFSYAIFCYLFGMFLFWVGYIEAEHEVSNQFNLFQKEMRTAIKTQRLK